MKNWVLGAICAAIGCAPAQAVVYNVNFSAQFQPSEYEFIDDPVPVVSFSGVLDFNPNANVDPTTTGLTVNSFNLPVALTFAYCAQGQTLIIGNNIRPDRDCYAISSAPDMFFIAVGNIFSNPVIYNVVQTVDADPPCCDYQHVSSRTGNFSIRYAGPVPEPSTWAMLILGFGMLGGAMRQAARSKRPLPCPIEL